MYKYNDFKKTYDNIQLVNITKNELDFFINSRYIYTKQRLFDLFSKYHVQDDIEFLIFIENKTQQFIVLKKFLKLNLYQVVNLDNLIKCGEVYSTIKCYLEEYL